jgi:hypothetical protein
MSDAVQIESVESRLLSAGFARSAHMWLAPGDGRALSQEDAIAALDTGEYPPQFTMTVPDFGVRALPDEVVERMFAPPAEPPWLERLAELVAEKLKPAIRAEARKGLGS